MSRKDRGDSWRGTQSPTLNVSWREIALCSRDVAPMRPPYGSISITLLSVGHFDCFTPIQCPVVARAAQTQELSYIEISGAKKGDLNPANLGDALQYPVSRSISQRIILLLPFFS
jgi:hypothetical protein